MSIFVATDSKCSYSINMTQTTTKRTHDAQCSDIEVYTRDNVARYKGHMARQAERLFAEYPGATKVTVARVGAGRVVPDHTEIVYRASSGGKWGKSSSLRIGNGVGESQSEILAKMRRLAFCLYTAAVSASGLRLLQSRGLLEQILAYGSYNDKIALESVAVDLLQESTGCERNIATAVIANAKLAAERNPARAIPGGRQWVSTLAGVHAS